MKALIQRVSQAEVRIAGQVTSRIGAGLLVFICAEPQDTPATGERLLAKILKLRIFADGQGKMNRSVQEAAACSSSASSRWPPTHPAATAPALRAPRRPPWAASCMTISWPAPAPRTPRWPRASSEPTCRWR